MADDKVPGSVTTFYKRKKKADHVSFSRENAHGVAYQAGIENILKKVDKYKGKTFNDFNPEDFEDDNIMEAFIDGMVKKYVSVAKQELHGKSDHKLDDKEKDFFYEQELLKRYTGMNQTALKAEIKGIVKEHGGNALNEKNYTNIHEKYNNEMKQELMVTSASHFKKSDIKDITSHVGIKNKVDTDRMQETDLINILLKYNEGKGAVTDDFLKNTKYHTLDKKKKK